MKLFPAESCARSTNPKLPVDVGVPEMTPADENVNPGGSVGWPSAEGVIVKEYGGVPPTTVKRCEYGVPTMGVLMGPATMNMTLTLSVNVRRSWVPAESVAIRSNVYWRAVDGIPARIV